MTAPIRILLVEDNPRDAELIERELRRGQLNFTLRSVSSENGLRQELHEFGPNIILSDYNLPEFGGIEAFKIASDVAADLPFIFVSGSIGEERAVEVLREGATDYILKDRLSRLPSAVSRALAERAEHTLRRQTQDALERLRRHQELILESASEGIISVDGRGKVIVVNPAAVKMTGFSPEEFRGAENLHMLIHHSRPDGGRVSPRDCPVFQTLADGKPRTSRNVFWRKSGETLAVELSCSPIREDSQVTGCVVMFEDISHRKNLEMKIQQAQRVESLGRVAATIAHEFNNVLMGIQPFAEVIRRVSHEEKSANAAMHIMNSVARGRRVTQEILRFTQSTDPAFETVDLAAWTGGLLPELKGLAGDRIQIELKTPRRPVMSRCDPAQIHQVVTNLVLNARDAMPSGGQITIEVAQADTRENVSLTVRDTGHGMSQEVLDHIFEPMFTTKKSGTGLGLAVAQQVVDRNGGSIRAQSAPNEGTKFTLLLPAASQIPSEKVVTLLGKIHLKSLLIVDDDDVVVSGLTALLESDGVRVHSVDHGAKVMNAIETLSPDAVVLDVGLPDMSGVEVYRQIAERWPALPVLFSTGHGGSASLEAESIPNHVGFLQKPYDFTTLLSALDRISSARSTMKGT